MLHCGNCESVETLRNGLAGLRATGGRTSVATTCGTPISCLTNPSSQTAMTSRRLRALGRRTCILSAVLCTVGSAFAATPEPIAVVAPGVYALMGRPGETSSENLGRNANAAFVVGARGVVVVDSGVSLRHGEAIIAAVARVTRQPIRLLVLTHPGPGVVFGAAAFQARGIPVWMHRSAAATMAQRCDTCLRNLREELGERTMAGTRIVKPDRVVSKRQSLDPIIGRRLVIMVPDGEEAPGALAVWDETTGTLIAGGLASIDRIPDLPEVDGKAWPKALAELEATKCVHLVAAFGRIGTCADLDALARYFAALEAKVRTILAAGVGLADVRTHCDLPEFAAWDGYAERHVRNANRTYLRMEREVFND
jgi:glyoxylase-like metal-dependent hydrolase (beta-lactamase superfamily II)